VHYLITGHTGFKGSWLSLMLKLQGHTVSGISLNPPKKSLFNQSNLSGIFQGDFRIDILNRQKLDTVFKKIDPEVVVHLAAQPLVLQSLKDPIETFKVNLLGTLNVLESTKTLKNLKATLIVTTDKVYKNNPHQLGYIETDELGGDDPYSASKAAADIASQVWAKNYANSPVAVARAGNVIGGGDWADNRIIPDLARAFTSRKVPKLRNPDSIRPWQHVLDCLYGYITLIDYQLESNDKWCGAWNFGPDFRNRKTVLDLALEFGKFWGISSNLYDTADTNTTQEVNYLSLNSSKARLELNWSDQLNFTESIKWTAEWYLSSVGKSEAIIKNQIYKYFEMCGV
jgi:CDP-glucose 4,6-dehydratase